VKSFKYINPEIDSKILYFILTRKYGVIYTKITIAKFIKAIKFFIKTNFFENEILLSLKAQKN